MARDKGGFKFASNFEVKIQGLLDPRLGVENKEDLINKETFPYDGDTIYMKEGMLVTVSSTKEVYMLVSLDKILAEDYSGWKRVSNKGTIAAVDIDGSVDVPDIDPGNGGSNITEQTIADWGFIKGEEGKLLSTEDFTTALKQKLESLNNYDDGEILNAVTRLRTDFDTLVGGNPSSAIESFNEIIAFLEGIEDSQSLDSIIASIELQIANVSKAIPTKLSSLINDAGFIDSSALDGYLPLSGGELLTPNFSVLTLKRNNNVTNSGIALTFANKNTNNICSIYAIESTRYLYRSDTVNNYKIWDEGNFNPSDYLPLSGGTISNTGDSLIVKRLSDIDSAYIRYNNNEGQLGTIGVGGSGATFPYEPYFQYKSGAAYKLWHSGNDGADSGLDADLLDGYHGSSYWKDSSEKHWTPKTNIIMTPTDNGQEWSFDFRNKGSYTGSYWQVWDDTKNSLLRVFADTGKVEAPYGFVGDLIGVASSASKLATARTIWGQSFDGSEDVSNNLTLDNNKFILAKNTSGAARWILGLSNGNELVFGGDTAALGYDTVVYGNNTQFRYGTSKIEGMRLTSTGNVLIGTTTDSGYKLDVNGSTRINGIPVYKSQEGALYIEGSLIVKDGIDGYATTTDLETVASNKQDTLVSGTNIKTINNKSLLGSGNISISSGISTPLYQLKTYDDFEESVNLAAGTVSLWPTGVPGELQVSFATKSGYCGHWILIFPISHVFTVWWPTGLYWASGSAPSFQAGKTYIIHVYEGQALYATWDSFNVM